MSFPAYPSYRESGQTWLGDVPTHWDVVAGRRLFRQMREPSQARDEQLSASQKYGVIPQSVLMEREDQKVVLALNGLDGFKHVEVDDFVISLRSFQGGIEHSSYSGCVSPAYTVLRPTYEQVPGYYRYLLKALPYISALQTVTDGIRDGKNISYEQFGKVSLPTPPLPEQNAVAAFLDRETAKIDALVEEQRRLIELLKEKRQAVISHAVTKGLDPNVPMKDSGVEWLGDVPAHWAVTSVGRLCEQLSYGFTNPMPTSEDGPFMLTANDIGDGQVRFETARRTTLEAFDTLLTEKSRPQAGDILLTKDGTLGRIAVFDGTPSCINQSVAFLRPKVGSISSDYLAAALADGVYQDRMIYEAGGTTIKHIYISRLAKMPIAIPPLDEMKQLEEFCLAQRAVAEQLSMASDAAVALLQERRAALISAAVTGKIDVRATAAQPAEAA